MNLFYYLLETNAYLLGFYAFFRIFLRNETFYTLNRFYLTGTTLLSFILPLFKLSGLQAPVVHNIQYAVYTSGEALQPESFWTTFHIVLVIYLAIAAFFLILLAIRVYRISSLIRQGKLTKHDNFRLVEIRGSDLSFSFMNYLFVNPELQKIDTIIRHEQVHIRQLHSLDILFFEIIQIVCWFNPVIKLMQNDIKAVHEYIADEETATAGSGAADYALFLIQNSYGASHQGLGSQMFSKTLLKKRIMMLHQKRSKAVARLKYVCLFILAPLMICVSAMAFTKTYGVVDLMPKSEAFQNATKKYLQTVPNSLKKTSTLEPVFFGTNDERIKNLTWHQIVDMLAKEGKRLPTEAELENHMELLDKAAGTYKKGYSLNQPQQPASDQNKDKEIWYGDLKDEDELLIKNGKEPGNYKETKAILAKEGKRLPTMKEWVSHVETQIKNGDTTKKMPAPPKPKTEQVKFPPVKKGVSTTGSSKKVPPEVVTPKPKTEQVKFPPAKKAANATSSSKKVPPEVIGPKPKTEQVKFPPAKVVPKGADKKEVPSPGTPGANVEKNHFYPVAKEAVSAPKADADGSYPVRGKAKIRMSTEDDAKMIKNSEYNEFVQHVVDSIAAVYSSRNKPRN